jgi:hypothetical protein
LAAQPASDVTVTVSKNVGGDGDVNADQTALVFSAANWNVAQTVNVTASGRRDAVNGQATFTIASTGLTSKTVTATEVDNDTQALVVSHTAISVPEASQSLFTIQLAAQPTADVTVSIAKTPASTGSGHRQDDVDLHVRQLERRPIRRDDRAGRPRHHQRLGDVHGFFDRPDVQIARRHRNRRRHDAPAGTYYVNLNGSDSNPGNGASAPWKTVAKVNSMTFIPGDTILFQGQQSFNGSIFFDVTRHRHRTRPAT